MVNNYNFVQSKLLFQRAQQSIPGGVNSPVRAFKAVGGDPIFIAHAKGAYLWDADGNKFIDYVGSWGPMIVGHTHPYVQETLQKAIQKGTSFGAPTENEIILAEKIKHFFPSIEQLRMVSTGTEATMSAIRLARGVTQREKIIKFQGCYHGHSDALLVEGGSGLATLGQPNSAGVPPNAVRDTLVLPYNDLDTLENIFNQYGNKIAGAIIEPIAGNMNLIPANQGFLINLRKLCTKHKAILIFDEVMSGFRVAIGGAQSIYGIEPELTCLGKIIGGGLPAAAFGGKKYIMSALAPEGNVYQAGTLSGNPLAVSAGIATLDIISKPGFFNELSNKAKMLIDGLVTASKKAKIPFCAHSIGGMFGLYFSSTPPNSWKEAIQANTKFFRNFFWKMIQHGHYFPPSIFESGFISIAHSENDIAKTIDDASKIFHLIDHSNHD